MSMSPTNPTGSRDAGDHPHGLPDQLVDIGQVVATQGLRGELRVAPTSDFPERFLKPGPRWLRKGQGPPRPVELLRGRRLANKGLFVLQLRGVDSREAAEELRGQRLLVNAAERPDLQEGEFHLMDLEGLDVRLDPAGPAIGTVVNLVHGGNDLLEIRLRGWEPLVLVPFVEAIVPRIELEAGWLLLTPPSGLLPERP